MRTSGIRWVVGAFVICGCATSEPEDRLSADGAVGSGGKDTVAAGHSQGGSAKSQGGGLAAADATVAVDHHIVRDTCQSERLSQDFIIEPGLVCAWQGGARVCTSGIECFRPEDCGTAPFVRCVGSGEVSCDYPVPAHETCLTDSDCVALPDGRCEPPDGPELLCTPSGECEAQTPFCYYQALWVVCQTDAERG
jgi:hypothetical protein